MKTLRFLYICTMVSLPLISMSGLAGSTNIFTENPLVFRAPVSDPLKRTFSVRLPAGSRIDFCRSDLIDSNSGAAILATQLTIEPLQIKVTNETTTFEITIKGNGRPGCYVGPLVLTWGTSAATNDATLMLNAISEAVPAVDADVNSKNLNLGIQPNWWDMPYLGVPIAHNAPVLAEVRVDLVQNAEGPATLYQAEVLTARTTSGVSLPAGAVTVQTPLPVRFESRGTRCLVLQVSGRNLDAGEYNASLRAQVSNQNTPVIVPLKIQVKHGPLLALMVLVAGLATAAFSGWWGSDGKESRELMRSIEVLNERINSPRNMPFETQTAARELWREAVAALNRSTVPAEVRNKVETAQKMITEMEQRMLALLNQAGELRRNLEPITLADTMKTRLLQGLEQMETGIREGTYPRASDAEAASSKLQRAIGHFMDIIAAAKTAPVDKQTELVDRLNKATTFTGMRQAVLDVAQITVAADPQLASFSAQAAAASTGVAPANLKVSLKRKLQLYVGAFTATAVFYLFALAVGWVSLYASVPTFGATPKEYISLFLWAVAVEAVRGKTLTPGSLQIVSQEKRP